MSFILLDLTTRKTYEPEAASSSGARCSLLGAVQDNEMPLGNTMPIRRLGQATKDRRVIRLGIEYELSDVGGRAAFGGLRSPSPYALVGGGGLRLKRRRIVARLVGPLLQLISAAAALRDKSSYLLHLHLRAPMIEPQLR
jgi:hypothetical protein